MREIDCKMAFEKWELGDFRFVEARRVLAIDPGFSYAYFRGEHGGHAVVGGVRYGNKVYYSVSLCSPQDNFSKKDGKGNVFYHFCGEMSGNKRGMLELKEDEVKLRTGVILKWALLRFIARGRSVPRWAKHTTFSFMNEKK
jgi:hypothetical protein